MPNPPPLPVEQAEVHRSSRGEAFNLIVPNIKVHPTRATLDIALREALRAAKK